MLVTGAGGFIGRHLVEALRRDGHDLQLVTRSAPPAGARRSPLRLLEPDESRIARSLEGIDTVYFLGAIAHRPGAEIPPSELSAVNVAAPVRWLRAAARTGIRRFIWLSSIKVLGDRSLAPLDVDARYQPGDAYAHSKVAAELELQAIARGATDLSIVRPPLVYGPGVAGNMLTMLRWSDSALPLPLALARAPRSLVAVANLCDLLLHLGRDGAGIFHVADRADTCVAELLGALRRGLGRAPRLFPVPPAWFGRGARLARREALFQRLFEPLQVDQSATAARLDWRPGCPAESELGRMLAWYREWR